MSENNESEIKRLERASHEALNEVRRIAGLSVSDNSNIPAEPPLCSFCGKGKNQVQTLIAGPSVFICNECVDLGQAIIRAEKKHQ